MLNDMTDTATVTNMPMEDPMAPRVDAGLTPAPAEETMSVDDRDADDAATTTTSTYRMGLPWNRARVSPAMAAEAEVGSIRASMYSKYDPDDDALSGTHLPGHRLSVPELTTIITGAPPSIPSVVRHPSLRATNNLVVVRPAGASLVGDFVIDPTLPSPPGISVSANSYKEVKPPYNYANATLRVLGASVKASVWVCASGRPGQSRPASVFGGGSPLQRTLISVSDATNAITNKALPRSMEVKVVCVAC